MSTKTPVADGPLPHTYRQSHPLLSAETIARLKPEERSHFLDKEVKRNTLSLGDIVGLEVFHVEYLVHCTVLHWHTGDEEWIYILSGRGMAEMTVLEGDFGAGVDKRTADDVEVETKDIGPGDFFGFKRSGRAHMLVNTGTEDLVYLLGGERNSHDQCTYPKMGKTLHITREKGEASGGIVDNEHIRFWKRA
ncbi:cupin domain-containing protein [Spizellomyces punctatus DAOM BR117]|uniref:Cupin domain-containing protein n=1 Tax=Spizellomyces punctatus (strain DAOM BR117) TaxID=645134 RepID=A0A0L0HW03_SPIPD|nr:cupin domain-containing protein [Spizellomyces punctatus DAOM BR117]KND05054.1 cupin domain-containing protein [Spizellomyces punctatus DAOM BR117]|eukprot:XP_016613093.1 cupin domain-containing protein [Spizellomyces punctatus DAOM BR117]